MYNIVSAISSLLPIDEVFIYIYITIPKTINKKL